MRRRDFLAGIVGMTALGRIAQAEHLPADLKVTRIVSFDLPTRRSKVAGKNSRRDVHGDQSADRMVRLFTNHGVEGLGNCRASKDALAALLGRNPFVGYQPGERRMPGPLGSQTMPLWDLAGKLVQKPVYALLGAEGRLSGLADCFSLATCLATSAVDRDDIPEQGRGMLPCFGDHFLRKGQ